ncbi:uncharacterized protein LOC115877478 [Sitophilus oryzae]|uniref:Uncharacterized protein LOC115877478 n=1 Tax=Sitophilus oryzae TaxID=7048 RepID=A0A6J2XFH4_SITOR|nr:uncharacterized protein LOC115877478 [Sitophilus oryzae]
MGLEDKQVQHNFDYDTEVFKENVYYCITYITHKCPPMQEFFTKWIELSCRQKALLNYNAFYILENPEMSIFSSIIKGVNYWNNVQDTEGACGYNKNPFEFRLGKEEESHILQVVADANRILRTVRRKAVLCKEIDNYNFCYQSNKVVFLQKLGEVGDINNSTNSWSKL